jgi:hypothetical protein
MIDEKLALLRTHRNNISRYRRLLKTQLTECERQRETLVGGTFRDGKSCSLYFPSHLPNAGNTGEQPPLICKSSWRGHPERWLSSARFFGGQDRKAARTAGA